MKKLLLPLVVLIWVGISSCSEDDNNPSVRNDVINTVSSGSWKITYFFDTDKEETDNFTGYSFTFGTGNVLTASNEVNTYTGTWSITSSNSYDDSVDDLDFNIAFAAPDDFEELSEDWEILSRTDARIELRHISGGNGGTDLLTFEKD
jgi:hypothetical protein